MSDRVDLTTREGFAALAMTATAGSIQGLRQFGNITTTIFLVKPTGFLNIVAVAEGHPSDALRDLLADHEYIAWATISDAWIAVHPADDMAGLAAVHGRVRDMPGRGEAIICAGKHAPSGFEFMITQRYDRSPDGIVLVGEVVASVDKMDSPWAFGEPTH